MEKGLREEQQQMKQERCWEQIIQCLGTLTRIRILPTERVSHSLKVPQSSHMGKVSE